MTTHFRARAEFGLGIAGGSAPDRILYYFRDFIVPPHVLAVSRIRSRLSVSLCVCIRARARVCVSRLLI